MAERDDPYHNPQLGQEVQGWDMVGENVGVGWEVDGLHRAFMDSSTHRDIILAPQFTEIGVGVLTGRDGRLWVVEVFRDPTAEPTTVAPAGAPPATPPTSAPSRPAPIEAAPVATVEPAAATTATAAPATSTTSTSVASSAATDLELGFGEPVHRPPLTVRATSAPIVTVPELHDLAREIPAEAWLAAFLLASVVGGQGVALRRLGFVA